MTTTRSAFGWWVNYRRMPLLSWVEVVTQHSMFQKHDLVVQDWTVTFIWCSIAALTTCEFSASLISKDKGGLHELFKFFIPASKRVPISPLDQISSPKLKYAVNCTMFFKNVIEVHYTDDWLLPHTDRHTHTHTHTHTCTHARTHTRTHTHTQLFFVTVLLFWKYFRSIFVRSCSFFCIGSVSFLLFVCLVRWYNFLVNAISNYDHITEGLHSLSMSVLLSNLGKNSFTP